MNDSFSFYMSVEVHFCMTFSGMPFCNPGFFVDQSTRGLNITFFGLKTCTLKLPSAQKKIFFIWYFFSHFVFLLVAHSLWKDCMPLEMVSFNFPIKTFVMALAKFCAAQSLIELVSGISQILLYHGDKIPCLCIVKVPSL